MRTGRDLDKKKDNRDEGEERQGVISILVSDVCTKVPTPRHVGSMYPLPASLLGFYAEEVVTESSRYQYNVQRAKIPCGSR